MTKSIVLNSIFWSFSSQFASQFLSFVFSILLIRFLLPYDFGLLAMIAVFYSLSDVIVDSGLSVSIIRNKNLSQNTLSSIFFFNVILGLFLYFILFYSSSLIAAFFNQEVLINIIRIICLVIVFNSVTGIQKALMIKNFRYKTIAKINILAVFFSGIAGLAAAIYFGNYWALVIMNVLTSIFTCFLFWIFSDWKPSLFFSFSLIKPHTTFGYKLALTSVIDVIVTNVYSIIIGKFFSTTQTGLYAKADSLKRLTIFGITTPLKNLLLPFFSRIKSDKERLKEAYKQILNIVVFIISFLMFYMFFNAYEIFLLLFGEQWLAGVPYFKIICVSSILYPINTFVVNYLLVVGKSHLVLKFDLIKKLFLVIFIAISLLFNQINFLLYSLIAISITDFIINLRIINKELKITYKSQVSSFVLILIINIFSLFTFSFLFDYFETFSDYRICFYLLKLFLVFVLSAILSSFIAIIFFKSTFVFFKTILKR